VRTRLTYSGLHRLMVGSGSLCLRNEPRESAGCGFVGGERGMEPLNHRLKMVGIIWLAAVACLKFNLFDQMFDTSGAGCEIRWPIPPALSIASQEPRS
jgi:hypothetical protein